MIAAIITLVIAATTLVVGLLAIQAFKNAAADQPL